MNIDISLEEFKIIEKGLLELKGKECIGLILKLEAQAKISAPAPKMAQAVTEEIERSSLRENK